MCTKLGFPEKIQSDRGGEFTAKVCKSLYEVLQIRKLQTTHYHPQANGQVERFNRTMADMLAKICAEDQRNWDTYLSTITMEYNASVHRVTGETPHFLTYGSEFRFPMDVEKGAGRQTNREWRNSLIPELMKRLDQTIKRVEDSNKDNAVHYNKRRRPHKFVAGDRVLEWTMIRTNKDKGVHKKISLPGVGPYLITKVNEDGNTVQIIDEESPEDKTWVVNVSNLRRYIKRPEWMKDEKTVLDKVGPVDKLDIVDIKETTKAAEDRAENVSFGKPAPEDSSHSLCIRKNDLTRGLEVDVLVNNNWKCGVVHKTRNKGGLAVKVVGAQVNAWINPYRLRKCECKVKTFHEASPLELEWVKKRKYWKI
jgi:hypothetical protein